jgi:glycosyltransferase involved in cell wall biosynthesis
MLATKKETAAPTVVVVHPFGNPNAYNAALAFHERSQLNTFHTCLFNPLNSRLRYHEALRSAPISVHPALEAARLLLARLPKVSRFARSQRFVDAVGARCDLESSRCIGEGVKAVYGYEDFALYSFNKATALGAKRIYELPIGYYASAKTLLGAEAQQEPGLRPFFQSLHEPADKIQRKEAEAHLATHIVCASSFTASTVPESIATSVPITVLPYGADCSLKPKEWTESDQKGPLRLIFVGILGPRKGLHVLFRALNAIPKHSFELSLAGRWVPGFREFLDKRFSVSYTELGQVPQKALNEIYKQHHVLVFPSLFEGFGLVILEAMSAGIPVIATERTAGPDIFKTGSGFVVQAGNPEPLRQCIEHLLEDRKELPTRGVASREIAETLSWERYRSNLINEINSSKQVALTSSP